MTVFSRPVNVTETHKYLISDANSTIHPHKLIGLFQKFLWKLNNATITLFKKEKYYQNFPQFLWHKGSKCKRQIDTCLYRFCKQTSNFTSRYRILEDFLQLVIVHVTSMTLIWFAVTLTVRLDGWVTTVWSPPQSLIHIWVHSLKDTSQRVGNNQSYRLFNKAVLHDIHCIWVHSL